MAETPAPASLHHASPPAPMKSGARAILCGGLIAGTLDITYACVRGILRGTTAMRILQSVASGLLGRPAFDGGWEIAALGLALHFVIALSAATTYYLASRRLALMVNRPVLSGLLFGALVYLFMSRVVVPLSAAPFRIPLTLLDLAVHMFFIGLPIALSVWRYAR
ncbi:MAG: hypothetical protein L0212_05030 [Acidobacteria bacterium]|nr:hypothetical protein [Acidobacteriota bacterium]